MYDREGLDGIDIGFAFLLEFEKRGFAFEVANKIKEAAFDEFGIILFKQLPIKTIYVLKDF
ncbi:hypothetical protein [Francisella frigiditurris]|uniref:GNAT family acetyltransferase n=1 Tax=Francisella frigiditurris TaxID=1542390 RepID=A0A1J0KR83_9GAMM|nr:hypothetical protein [Francisella frigiditurris]APC96255.1 gNAT family acetyltransferase [Francisella frigiditurris]